TVMSDSDESMVTYIEVSSPFEGLSDIGSLGVVGPEYEGLPWMLDDSYVQERIEKTKRSKNDQKQTRNGKKTKSQEQDKEISQKSQPDQPETVKLSQRKK
ncbi:hypothetical protein Tco_1128994, partial [Tanacetum coccineum]